LPNPVMAHMMGVDRFWDDAAVQCGSDPARPAARAAI